MRSHWIRRFQDMYSISRVCRWFLFGIFSSTLLLASFHSQAKRFLDVADKIPPKFESIAWITVKSSEPFRCKISGEGSFAVVLVASRSYWHFRNNAMHLVRDKDVLFNENANRVFDRVIQVPRGGKYWFIVENTTATDMEIKITCWDVR